MNFDCIPAIHGDDFFQPWQEPEQYKELLETTVDLDEFLRYETITIFFN